MRGQPARVPPVSPVRSPRCKISRMARASFPFKSRWSERVVVCAVSACLCTVARGQNRSATDEVKQQSQQFVEQVFANCGDSSTYYLGPLRLPVLACTFGDTFSEGGGRRRIKTCEGLVEFRAAAFNRAGPMSPANELNGMKGIVTMTYSASRWRHILDGQWGPWEPWQDRPDARPSVAEGPSRDIRLRTRLGSFLRPEPLPALTSERG
jgi:hypothetical protein